MAFLVRSVAVVVVCSLALTGCGTKKKSKSRSPKGKSVASKLAKPHSDDDAATPTAEAADKSGRAWLKEANAALTSARDVHVKGVIGTGTAKVALDVYVIGTKVKGVIVGPMGGRSVKIGVIRTGGKQYLRAPAAWTALGQPRFAKKYKNRWILATPEMTRNLKDFNAFLTTAGLADAFVTADAKDVIKVRDGAYAGKPVVTLFDGTAKSKATFNLSAVGAPSPSS